MKKKDEEQLIQLREQIKSLSNQHKEYHQELKDLSETFHQFQNNDFHSLSLQVERLKISMGMNNKLTWAVLLSVLGLAFFVLRTII